MNIYQTPALVQSAINSGSGITATVTMGARSTAKNALLLFVGWSNNVTPDSVTDDGGNTWSVVSSRVGSGPYLQIWYTLHAESIDNVTVSFSDSASDVSLACHEYSGLAPGGSVVLDSKSGVTPNKENVALDAVTASQPALLFLGVQLESASGGWTDAGLTNTRTAKDASLTADETMLGGARSATVKWSDATNAAAQVVAFKAALAGTLLDDVHHYSLLIDSIERITQVRGMITVTQPEAGEIGTMRFTLQALGTALLSSVTAWKEVELVIDGDVYFGGYVISSQPALDQDQPDGWEAIDVVVEEWATALARTPPVKRRYVNTDPGDIVADLFNRALDPNGTPPNQTEFDTTTYVSAGSWGSLSPTFLVDNEMISEALDRLALLCNFVWWIDGNKRVHFSLAGSTSAPFSIATVQAANYTTSFPPLSKPTVQRDGSDIRNRVTVYGGVQVKKYQEPLTGDGSTLVFQLEHFPVVDMVLITVDGTLQSWGTDWYHSFDDYDVLVDYTCGTIRWNTGNAPANDAEIIVAYYYGASVQVTVYNNEVPTSYATYGRWFDYEVVDRSITNSDLAQAVAQAMVDAYEWETVDGRLQVERLGIQPGQSLTVVFPGLGLNAAYSVRQVVTEISRAGIARCDISFGNRRRTLGAGLEGTRQAGPLSRSTRWQDRILTTSLHPTGAKAQGSMMLSIGQTSTDQLAANTNNLGGVATAYQWPVYNKAGIFAGYVPVFGSAWAGAADSRYLLATGATTGATSQAQTFTNGIIGPTWKPASDSTTALQLQNAGGTPVVTIDTTNGRLGIGCTPGQTLEVAGNLFLNTASPKMYLANGGIYMSSDGTNVSFINAIEGGIFTFAANDAAGYCKFAAGGALRAILGATDFVINEAGDAYNFRVEGDAKTHLLFTDGVQDRVGVSCSSPDSLLHVQLDDAATNAASQLLTLSHNTSGTAANGFGSRVLFELKSSTTADQSAAALNVEWVDATHATRTGQLTLHGSYAGTLYEAVRAGAVSGAAALGFYGVTAIARPTTSSGAASFTANSGTAVNDASTFDGYTLKQVVKALRDVGLLT